jgi:hypothetical protein
LRTPAKSAEAAEWLNQRLLRSWSGPGRTNPVGAIVPTGFAAYARIFPWIDWCLPEEERLRWAELAAINGRVAHPLMEFHLIASPAPGHGPSLIDPKRGPLGPMRGTEIRELAEVLRDFTGTPDLCWYCVWDGYGGIEEREGGAQMIHFSIRDYFLSSGPIEEVTSFDGEGPDIWWPDDRAWCVGSDTDLAASYVGGSVPCIEALLSSKALEALPVSADDRVDSGADVINGSGD